MSKYTTEVRFICEEKAGLEESVGYDNVLGIIEKARPKIFDFSYPIFNENYRPVLETKILMHYYTREICEETVGLWKLRLRSRLNEIMPYYNQLYKSELIEFDPLKSDDYTIDRDVNTKDVHSDTIVDDSETKRTGNDLTTRGGRDITGSGGSDTTTNTRADKVNEWTLYSDTPQGSIAGIQGAEDDPSLGDNGYLTNATHVIGDTTGSTGNSTTNYGRTGTIDYGGTSRLDRNTKDEYDGTRNMNGNKDIDTDWFEKISGYRGIDPSARILKLRETFLNIDNMIIKELRDLFFNIW